jgi:hypothetical protein
LDASRQVAKASIQNVVERGAVGDLLLECDRARSQLVVRELFKALLERVDLVHARLIALDAPLVRRAKELAGDRADHAEDPSRVAAAPV